ncbi:MULTISPECIES: [FeFe] hydrogenase H-cluster maturation GTPase HydF [unclassified Pseudodesulfovibrio]|uniref:[FeFe] hydrogenase H-cluster maturation GTPase HydF n=1 Tax=unclassified Pseudodesulfovibrio TaxID=2661612 RepID=UPI000FEB8929|nr:MULTISPECIES: [FeFe] hydrogenase H-cluster maturation GTPase HydF [unclassified Pseudodesulfovibrio]MCJ2164374.1 [FeFe] hydrogenase H-cluster maturation GTPase HydF [Pseudodesulfovibrio sp. S3-i]RWU04582.1 [FeFe] hydrogenase H-cluster maturation GTPase HydF [Pseudodesulfovibrio sp. S3]
MSGKAPRGVRLIIALAGRRNAGKSSLINAITGQETAIVSNTPGTTTDPVAKHYELLPLGPVTFYDTAGLDDTGDLGGLRMQATRKILYRCDVAVIVIGEAGITEHERAILDTVRRLDIPYIVAFNKMDLHAPSQKEMDSLRAEGTPCLAVSALSGLNVDGLKQAIIDATPPEYRQERALVSDLINEGDWVVCVVPIDLAAPKGRLILPQVQVLREILDCDALGLTVKEREIEAALDGLTRKPALVITDSQVIMSVAADVPGDIPLTTFSTLFARYKGDLPSLVRGADAIDTLEDGDRVLIGEACSHHPVADDIGRVKIPRWMTQYTGKDLKFEVYSGHDFPGDLERFNLVVHCGACMLNRTEMLRRIQECTRRNIPVTNYGVAISKVQGVLDRVLAPFPL